MIFYGDSCNMEMIGLDQPMVWRDIDWRTAHRGHGGLDGRKEVLLAVEIFFRRKFSGCTELTIDVSM